MAKIYGTEDDDNLNGTTSADAIWLYGGNDIVRADAGNDRVLGGDGRDKIYGGSGADLLLGEAGNDDLEGDEGDDRLYGGLGDDYLFGGAGHDELYGGGGTDLLVDSEGADWLDGGGGIDTLILSLFANAGDLTFVFNPAGQTTPLGSTALHFEQINISAGDGNDSLTGANRNDTLRGWNGNDVLFGLGGDDYLIGDNGEDALWGGSGNDLMIGGGHYDFLHGGSGDDTLVGGSIFDVFPSGDFFDGGSGADTFVLVPYHQSTIDYGSSPTGVFFDLHQNFAYGGDAQGDSLGGFGFGLGPIIFRGSAFNDTFVGGWQQFGGDGADRLIAGPETTQMSGGGGLDRFVFRFDPGVINETPLVTDFDQAGHEILDVSALDARPAAGNQAFTFIGTAAFSGTAGELRYEVQDGRTLIQMQTDRDEVIEASLYLQGEYTLLATDFHL